MSRFYSLPGTDHRGSRNPRAREFYESRARSDGMSTGFQPGDSERFRGEECEVLGEERDQHRGVTEQYLRVGRGTQRVTWEKTGEGQTTIATTKRTFG